VDEGASVNLVEHCRILRRHQGSRMERLEAALLSDALRQRCVMAAVAYRLDTGREPYRLVVEESGEVRVTAAQEYFSMEEAAAKVGRRVETLVAFSGVPRGTAGAVVRYDEAGSGFDVGIAWELPERRDKPLVDWFSKDAYEECLMEW
jgi:hypothetical protein